jgi:hypothetical protein
MKTKILFSLLAIFFGLNSFAQTFTFGGLNYVITSSTTAQVGNNSGFNGAVSIPSIASVGTTNYSVTSISNSAFQLSSGLTSVSIPYSVTSIGDGAFNGCTGLTSINIPNSVTSLGESVFLGCSSLTSFTFPNSITSIPSNTFRNCSGLTSITIPNTITSIGGGAFQVCTSLTTLTIPNSVTNISNLAFGNCTGLTAVTVNWTTPLSITESVFSALNLPSISLNVPTGTAGLYDASPVWTDFNIATLGINELEFKNNKLIFYPNPASNLITIQTKANKIENFEYKIVDLTGRIVKSGNSKFNEQMNIENLQNGNYVIQIETEKGEKFSEKIIKN